MIFLKMQWLEFGSNWIQIQLFEITKSTLVKIVEFVYFQNRRDCIKSKTSLEIEDRVLSIKILGTIKFRRSLKVKCLIFFCRGPYPKQYHSTSTQKVTTVGCIFPMAISSEFRMEQHRDDNHREDARCIMHPTLFCTLAMKSLVMFNLGFSWVMKIRILQS